METKAQTLKTEAQMLLFPQVYTRQVVFPVTRSARQRAYLWTQHSAVLTWIHFLTPSPT